MRYGILTPNQSATSTPKRRIPKAEFKLLMKKGLLCLVPDRLNIYREVSPAAAELAAVLAPCSTPARFLIPSPLRAAITVAIPAISYDLLLSTPPDHLDLAYPQRYFWSGHPHEAMRRACEAAERSRAQVQRLAREFAKLNPYVNAEAIAPCHG